MIVQDNGLRGSYTVQRGDSLSALAERYGGSVRTLLDANRGALVSAQRGYCAGSSKPRCHARNAWGGMEPAGCCPDNELLDGGQPNIDLLPVGTVLEIAGYSPPPPVTPETTIIPTEVVTPTRTDLQPKVLLAGAAVLGATLLFIRYG